MYYGPIIIKETGLKLSFFKDQNQMAVALNIPLAFFNFIGGVVAIFYIDKLGRRYIMLRSIPFILIALIIITISMYFANYE